jgi:hypothetical protein
VGGGVEIDDDALPDTKRRGGPHTRDVDLPVVIGLCDDDTDLGGPDVQAHQRPPFRQREHLRLRTIV